MQLEDKTANITTATARYIPSALFVLAAAAAIACVAWAGPEFNITSTVRPPQAIIVVLIDALRPDHLSCYGYERPTSPNIDAIASEGVLFEDAYTNGNWTKPAVASLFTGRWAAETGAIKMMIKLKDGTEYFSALSPKLETTAEAVADKGYVTWAFVSNPNLSKAAGFGRGFATYIEEPADCDEIVRRFLQWQSGLPEGTRSFTYLHLLEPHAPYMPKERFRDQFGPHAEADRFIEEGWECPKWGMYRNAVNDGGEKPSQAMLNALTNLYDAEVAWTDDAVGALVRELKARVAYDETLLIVMADHGENLYEHGYLAHPATTLFEQQIRIPIVMKPPRSWQVKPCRVSGLAQTIDVTATITSAAGGPILGRGRSLVPFSMLGRIPEEAVISECFRAFAVRDGTRKIEFAKGDAAAKPVSLYDIGDDPNETRDILLKKPSYAARMTSRGSQWLEFVRAEEGAKDSDAPVVRPTQAQIDQLRALGYLGGTAAPADTR
jgi:arylsulfatase